MANPDVAMAFQNSKVQAAILDVCLNRFRFLEVFASNILTYSWFKQCSQNPLSIAKNQNDKEVCHIPIYFVI